MSKAQIGLIGARSLVGQSLAPILFQNNYQMTAFSRQHVNAPEFQNYQITWKKLNDPKSIPSVNDERIREWICISPIWVLSDYFHLLEAYGVKRIVVLSSTSRFSKKISTDPIEQEIAQKFASGEEQLKVWAESKGIEWIALRPTIIYGTGNDKNISEVVRFIRLLRFFPVFGKANGLRQPIHTDDVALACYLALQSKSTLNKCYNISGGEVLTYRQMIQRVFITIDRSPRLLTVPLCLFKFAVKIIKLIPRYRTWTPAMAERMNYDLAFDHSEATKDFGFNPRPFLLLKSDFQESS